MLDWAARIEDLTEFLEREYDVVDTDAIEILLSALVPCPRTANVWLVLETNWATPETDEAWFGFGGEWLPCSMAQLRGRGSWRERETKVRQWLDGPIQERLFIEPHFEDYPNWAFFAQGKFIQQRALRIRTQTPRTITPLNLLDQHREELTLDRLRALTENVIKRGSRWREESPPVFREPEHFGHYVELLQRLAPWFNDWRILLKSLGWIAVRHAYLHGRAETGPEETFLLSRILRDSVPPWIHKCVRALTAGVSKTLTIEAKMELPATNRRQNRGGEARSELTRLRRYGLVEYHQGQQNWSLTPRYRESVLTLLRGEAFSPNQAAAEPEPLKAIAR